MSKPDLLEASGARSTGAIPTSSRSTSATSEEGRQPFDRKSILTVRGVGYRVVPILRTRRARVRVRITLVATVVTGVPMLLAVVARAHGRALGPRPSARVGQAQLDEVAQELAGGRDPRTCELTEAGPGTAIQILLPGGNVMVDSPGSATRSAAGAA